MQTLFFSWLRSEGVTDIEIFNSSSLGERYDYNMFVGDINNGNLYFFTINGNRTGLDLGGVAGLQDLVADNSGGAKCGNLWQGIHRRHY